MSDSNCVVYIESVASEVQRYKASYKHAKEAEKAPMLVSPAAPMLGEYDQGIRKHWHPESKLWQHLHANGFLVGGTACTFGSAVLFFPAYGDISALFFLLGSCGFLFVDLQEFFTFDGLELRINISLNAIGSTFYVIGSVGFFPAVYAWSAAVGTWGFIIGSLIVALSQLWKTYRIGRTMSSDGTFSLATLLSSKDACTAAGVELSACIGACFFFFGTVLYNRGPLQGPASVLLDVLWMWLIGSLFFTAGACFLFFRHFVMDVC